MSYIYYTCHKSRMGMRFPELDNNRLNSKLTHTIQGEYFTGQATFMAPFLLLAAP